MLPARAGQWEMGAERLPWGVVHGGGRLGVGRYLRIILGSPSAPGGWLLNDSQCC